MCGVVENILVRMRVYTVDMQVWDVMGFMCGESVCMDRCGGCVRRDGCGEWRLDMSLVEGGLYLSSKNAGLGFTEKKVRFLSRNFYFTNLWTNIKHVCILLNAFHMAIPNMVMKLQNVDIFVIGCSVIGVFVWVWAVVFVGSVGGVYMQGG